MSRFCRIGCVNFVLSRSWQWRVDAWTGDAFAWPHGRASALYVVALDDALRDDERWMLRPQRDSNDAATRRGIAGSALGPPPARTQT